MAQPAAGPLFRANYKVNDLASRDGDLVALINNVVLAISMETGLELTDLKVEEYISTKDTQAQLYLPASACPPPRGRQ